MSLPGDKDDAVDPPAQPREDDAAAAAAREQRVNAIWKRIADAIAAAEENRRSRSGRDDDD